MAGSSRRASYEPCARAIPWVAANAAARSGVRLPTATTSAFAASLARRMKRDAMEPGPKIPQRTTRDDGMRSSLLRFPPGSLPPGLSERLVQPRSADREDGRARIAARLQLHADAHLVEHVLHRGSHVVRHHDFHTVVAQEARHSRMVSTLGVDVVLLVPPNIEDPPPGDRSRPDAVSYTHLR